MNYKLCCVIDAQAYYKKLVVVLLEPDDEGGIKENIQTDDLQETDRLIDATPPGNSFARPKWNENKWIEGGTEEEIAAWEIKKAQDLEMLK